MPTKFQESSYYGSQVDPMTGLQPTQGTQQNQSYDPMLGVWNSPLPAISTETELGSSYDTAAQPFIDLNRLRGERQPWIAQLGSALNQAVVGQVLGGTVEGVGYLLDLPQYVDLAEGTEQEFGNWFSELGNSIQQWGEEATPIYTTYKPGTFSPGHWSWWMSNAPSVASTLALVLPSAGVVRGLGALGKLTKVGEELGVASKWVAKGLTQAVVSRHMESMMDSNQTYNEVLDKALGAGVSDEEAQKKASIAASNVYKLEWASLAQDIPQYLLLNRAFNRSSIDNTLKVAEKMGQSTLPIVGKKSAAIGWDMLTEGAEEAYQYIAQKEGEYIANKAYDPSLKTSFSDRLDKYTSDGDFWTQGFFGALGAGVVQTTGKAINQMITGSRVNPRISDIDSWGEQFSYWNKRMKEAQTDGDESAERFSKDGLWTSLGVKSAQLGNIDNARDFLKTMQNPTKEDLERFNVNEDDLKVFQTEIPKGMEKLRRIGKLYNDNLKQYEPSKAAMVTYSQSLLEDQVANENRLQGSVNEDLSKIPNLSSLPANVQSYLLQSIDNKLIGKRIGFYDKAASKSEGIEKDNYLKHVNNLRDQLSKNIKLLEELDLSKEEKELINPKSDKFISIESKGLEDYIRHKQELGYTRHATLDLQKDLETIKKKDFLSTPEERKKHEESKKEQDKESSPYIPTVDDIIVHTSPSGESTVGRLNNIDKENGHSTITPLDKNGDSIGNDIVVDINNISLYQKEDEGLKEALHSTESVNEDEVPTITKKLYGESKRGLRDVSSAVSHSNFDEDQQKTVVRNKAFDLHISNPNNKLKGDKVKFGIDTSTDDSYKSKLWGILKDVKTKIDSGHKFSKEEIDDVVGSRKLVGKEDNFNSVVDIIPIKVSYTSSNGTSYDNGLYYHDSNYDNIYIPADVVDVKEYIRLQKEKTRKYRQLILTALLSGQSVELLNVEKTIGIPNNTDINRNIDEVLKENHNNIKLAVVDSTGKLWTGHGETMKDSDGFNKYGTPGNVFFQTNKTCNGEVGTIKCNISKLSEEHAKILFNAIITKSTEGKGGRHAKYEGEEVDNLTVGQVIDLLVLFGPATNINHPNNIGKDNSYLENKQLFIDDKFNLHYGKNVVNLELLVNNKQNADLERSKFVDWATMFKNYAVSKQNKELKLELNKPMSKVFKIGSWSSDGNDTYAGSIIKNGLVKTDVQEFEDTGSLFHAPVTIVDLSESGLDIKPSEETKEQEVKYAAELEKVSRKKTNQPENTGTKKVEVGEEVKPKIDDLSELKSLSVNSNIYAGITSRTSDVSGKETTTITPKLFISVIDVKGKKRFQIKHPRALLAFDLDPKDFQDGNNSVEVNDTTVQKLSTFLKGYKEVKYDTSKSIEGLKKEIAKAEPVVETPKVVEEVKPTIPSNFTADPLADVNIGEPTPFRLAYTTSKEYKLIDLTKETKWFRDKLGDDIPIEIKNGLIYLAMSSKKAFGQFTKDCIKLSDVAEVGTIYHEAYHNVSLLYLDENERQAIYNEAKQKYSKELPDKSSNKQVEEFLAEKFREYVINKEQNKDYSLSGKIGEFFSKLFQMIKEIFTGKNRLTNLDIDKLFTSIQSGKFRNYTPLQSNLDALGTQTYEMTYKGSELESILNYKQLQSLVRGLSALAMKDVTTKLFEEGKSKYATIDMVESVQSLNLNDLKNKIGGIRDEFEKYAEFSSMLITIAEKQQLTPELASWLKDLCKVNTISQLTEKVNGGLKNALRLADLYQEVLNNYDGIFKDKIKDYISKELGVRTVNEEEEEENITNKEIGNFDKESYEISAKDNIYNAVKFLLHNLHESASKDPMTGLHNFVRFDEIWSRLANDLHGEETIEDMISILESIEYYPYQQLAKKLKLGSELLRTQFLTSLRKHRHSFINAMFKSIVDGSGNVSHPFYFIDADIQEVSKGVTRTWGEMLAMSSIVVDNKLDSKRLDPIIAEYDNLTKDYKFAIRNQAVINTKYFKDRVVNLLKSIYVDVDSATIDNILTKEIKSKKVGTEEGALENLITSRLYHLFSKEYGTLYKYASGKEVSSKKVVEPKTLLGNETIVKELAQAYAEVNITSTSDNVTGPEGNNRHVFADNSYVTDVIHKLTTDEKYVTYLKSDIFSNHSRLLKQLENKEIRDKVSVKTFNSFIKDQTSDSGRNYLSISPIEDFLFKLYLTRDGYTIFPTLADRRTYYMLKGFDTIDFNYQKLEAGLHIPDEVVDIFYKYALAEKERIDQAWKTVKSYSTLDSKGNIVKVNDFRNLVENYHYITEGKKRNIEKGLAYKYQMFSSLNGLDTFNQEDIRKILENNIQRVVNYAKENDIVTEEGGLLSSKLLDKTIVESLTKEYGGDENTAIRSILASYTVNSLSSAIENTMLFSGDIAFYKPENGNPIDEYIKRLSVLTSSGVIPRENIPGEFENDTYNTVTLVEQKLKSNYYDILRERQRQLLLPKYGGDEKQVGHILDKILRDYDGKVKPTDAQVYLSPDMFREISIRRGEWSDKKQGAFELLQSTTKLEPAQEQELLDIVLQPLKYVYFDRVAYDINDVDKLLIPTYDKMSMATLFRRFVDGTHLENLLDRMEAKGKYANKEKIGMVKFETAVKVGNRLRGKLINNPDTSEQSEMDFSTLQVYSQNFAFLRHQVVTNPHEIQKTLLGSQVKKILQANIIDDSEYTVGTSKVKGKDLKSNINKALSTLSDKEVVKLLDKLEVNYSTGKMDDKAFYKMLADEARIAGMPENVQETLRMQLPIDILPERKWILNRFISVVNKYAIDLHLPGQQLIQMTGFGLGSKEVKDETNNLKFLFDSKSKDAKINGIECKISVHVFKDVIPDYDKKSWEDKVQWLKDNPNILEGIGYRIPTQGQNSTVLLKVVEFLPEQIGDVIALPNEFTALTGSDFDIDKLFFVRYNYYTGKDGKATKVKFLDDTNSKVEKRYNNIAREAFYDHKSIFDKESYKENYSDFKEEIQKVLVEKGILPTIEEFGKLDMFQQNTKLAVQNHLLDHYKAILLSEDHFLSTSAPLGAVTNRLKSLSDEITTAEESGEIRERTSLDFANPVYQAEVKYKYSGGKSGVGPSALSNTHHILCQVADISFNKDIGIGKAIDGNTSLHELYGQPERDGQKILISDWLSALIDAHVDIAKDPYIINLNVTRRTYNMIGLLLRVGVGEKSFEFLSQPILKELVKESTNLEGSILKPEFIGLSDSEKNKAILVELKSKWNQQLQESYKTSGQTEDQITVELQGYDPFTDDLLELIKTPKDKRDSKWYYKQLQILNIFDILDKGPAKQLSRLVMASRVDTKKYGNNLTELKMYIDSIISVYKDNNFTNINKLIPFDPETITVHEVEDNTFLGTYLKNSILLINQLMEDKTITATTPFNTIVDGIVELSKNTYAKDKEGLLNKIADDVHTAFLSRFFTDKNLLNLKPSQITSVFNNVVTFIMDVNANVKHPELKDNYLIQSLTKGLSFEEDKTLPGFLGIPTVKSDDNFVKEDLTFAWQELLQSDSEDVKKFAKELFVYSFYTSGFKKGLFSIFHYIPPQLFKELEIKRENGNDILDFGEYVQGLNDSLRDSLLINSVTVGIQDEVFRNNWNNEKLVPQLILEKGYNQIYVDKQRVISSIFSSKKDRELYLGRNQFDQPIYKPYIHYIVNNEISYLMHYIGYNEQDNSPVYKVVQKFGYYSKGKTIKEYGLLNSFLKRNQVVEITDEKALEEIGKNSMYKSFVYVTPEARKLGERKPSQEDLSEISVSTTEERSLNIGAEIGQETGSIKFIEEQSSGYRERTIKNASADATIAIAVDFSSAGEKLTKTAVEDINKKIYLPVNLPTIAPSKPDVVQNTLISDIVKKLLDSNSTSINIAGNGIYTFNQKSTGYTQEFLDEMVYQLINLINLNLRTEGKSITSIRTGGQTGIDEAGAKAGIKLGIPTTILAPKGWKFRDISGTDISNEQQFKQRFVSKETSPTVAQSRLQERTEKGLPLC